MDEKGEEEEMEEKETRRGGEFEGGRIGRGRGGEGRGERGVGGGKEGEGEGRGAEGRESEGRGGVHKCFLPAESGCINITIFTLQKEALVHLAKQLFGHYFNPIVFCYILTRWEMDCFHS